jgi:hypothetical protein
MDAFLLQAPILLFTGMVVTFGLVLGFASISDAMHR